MEICAGVLAAASMVKGKIEGMVVVLTGNSFLAIVTQDALQPQLVPKQSTGNIIFASSIAMICCSELPLQDVKYYNTGTAKELTGDQT